MVINRVAPVPVAKVVGVLYACIGLVFGAIVSLVALAGGMSASADEPGVAALGIFGAAAVVLLPILYGCLGFVTTLVAAMLYNVIARTVGGVQIDVS